MPPTQLAERQLGPGGSAAAFTAMDLVNGNSYIPRTGRLLVFRHSGASAVNVTVVTPGTVGGNQIDDRVISVPNGAVPFYVSLNEASPYRDPNTGLVTITAAAAMDVDVLQT